MLLRRFDGGCFSKCALAKPHPLENIKGQEKSVIKFYNRLEKNIFDSVFENVKSRGLRIRRYLMLRNVLEEISAREYIKAPNLATWLLSMVAGCIQPTLSSFSGKVTLCSCMNVKLGFKRPKFVLRGCAEFDKYFHSRALPLLFYGPSESRFDSLFAGLPVFWLQIGSRSQVAGFFVVVKSL